MFPFLRFYIDNPDTFSYLAVAGKYFAGDFHGALNGTWSPMISWLLSLVLFTGMDPVLLFKILQVILGGIGIVLASLLIDRFKMTRIRSILLKVSLVPVLLSYSLLLCSPDLLFLDLLMVIHLLLLRKNSLSMRNSFRIGLSGALLYLAKAYGILFFPLLCLFFYALLFFSGKEKSFRQSVAKSLAVSLAVFVILSAGWVAMISSKYHRFTISDAAGYNFLTAANEAKSGVVNHPILTNGLLDPTPNGSLFAWEDPALYTGGINSVLEHWDPGQRMQVLRSNLMSLYYYQYRHQIGWLFLLSCLIGLALLREKKIAFAFVLCLFTAVVFPCGYLVIYLAPRYIWILSVLMAILIFYVADLFAVERKNWISFPLVLLCILFLVKRPLKEILWREDLEKSSAELFQGITHPLATLQQTYETDRLAYAIADSLAKRKDLKGNVAGYLNPAGSSRDSYSLTLFLCYRLGNPYFGQIAGSALQATGIKPLVDHGIKFFYVWGEAAQKKDSLLNFPVTFEDPKNGLRIYRLMP